MSALLFTVVVAAVGNNLALDALLGLCPLLALSRRHEIATAMAGATIIVLPVYCTIAHALEAWVLRPLAAESLRLLLWMLVIAAITGVLERWLYRVRPAWHAAFGALLPLFGANCLVLGAVLLATTGADSIGAAFSYGIGTAAGYAAVLVVTGSLRERLSMTPVPGPMRGAAVVLVTLGLLSLALMGLAGIA